MKRLVQPIRLFCFFTLTIVLLTTCNLLDEKTNTTQTPPAQPGIIPTGRALVGSLDPQLKGVIWQLLELRGTAIPEEVVFLMEFTEDGLEGDTGCSNWSSVGDVIALSGKFSIEFIANAGVHCGEIIEYEDAFFETIQAVQTYRFDNHLLVLQGVEDGNNLTFAPIEK